MNLGRDLARLALGILLVTFAVGLLVGSCDGRVARRDLSALRDSVATYAARTENARQFAAMDRRAADRATHRADSLVSVADSLRQITARLRAAVAVDGTTVVSTPDARGHVDTLATDPRVAATLTAMDARHVADSLALGGLRVAVDTLTQALASSDSLVAALGRQLAAQRALTVAVERVNRRPRLGFTAGAVVGVVATATLVHLARP